MQKKSQVALEFIMNYGWVILIIIILAIVMAFYMFRADLFGSDRCVMGAGFGCGEFYFSRHEIRVNLLNSMGKDLDTPVTGELICSQYNYDWTDTYNAKVRNGHNFSFSLAPLPDYADRASCRLVVKYKEDRFGAYERQVEGKLLWKKITMEGTPLAENCGWAGDDNFNGCGDDTDWSCNHREIDIAGQCTDGSDNDCDGLADCADYQDLPGDPNPGDCCMAIPRCNDANIDNEAQYDRELTCICHDRKNGGGTWNHGGVTLPLETDIDCGGWCRNNRWFNLQCTEGKQCNEDADCVAGLACDSTKHCINKCFNDEIDPPESDTISGLGKSHEFGPYASDCGRAASGCALCGEHRKCNGEEDCAPGFHCIDIGDLPNLYCG